MSCLKSQKQCVNDQEMDHISTLPDSLLCHILSFVPTKSAVATSLLSRRWISVWTNVPVLDFTAFPSSVYAGGELGTETFNSFIMNVLLHNDTRCLQRLHLLVCRRSNMRCVNSLFNSMSEREIWEIHLARSWTCDDIVPVQLPAALFARERLVVLKISGPFEIKVPLSFHLPRLKTLYLRYLKFVGQNVSKTVTADCSSLRELLIEHCYGLRKLYVDSPTLSRFTKRFSRGMMVAVSGPNIRFLDLDEFAEQYDISDLSSLVEARIRLSSDEASRQLWALELIRRISHVKTLYLAQSTVEVFGHFCENELPIFPNLTRLEIQIADSIFRMLEHAPSLKHLIVDLGVCINDKACHFVSEIIPQCLLSLPSVEIRNFRGFDNDIELIRYILKNATILKELKIHLHLSSMKDRRDAYNRLLSFPRVSSCQVIRCSCCGDS
ncbi:hypothetical protein RDABS01_008718 [Bienertia sinuspersici]